MRHEIAPYHLPIPTDVWEETPLWCSYCGQQRLLGKRTLAEGELLLKCPACSPGADEALSVNHIPQLQGVKGYKPLLYRLRAWCDHYYRTGLANGFVVCETCGHTMPVSISLFKDLPDWVHKEKDSPRCAWRNNDRPVSILLYILSHVQDDLASRPGAIPPRKQALPPNLSKNTRAPHTTGRGRCSPGSCHPF
ncbi:MAG TPA: hypothetical protein DCL75_01890 [Ktedonobacter sp.]|nr:hypothetical protein [Ktedonobacter sp.]